MTGGRKKNKAPKGKSLITPQQEAQQETLTQQLIESRARQEELLTQQTQQFQKAYQSQLQLIQQQQDEMERARREQLARQQELSTQQQAQQEEMQRTEQATRLSTEQALGRSRRPLDRQMGLIGRSTASRTSRRAQVRNTTNRSYSTY